MPDKYCELHDLYVAQDTIEFEYDLWYAHGTKWYHYEVDLIARTQKTCDAGTARANRPLASPPPYRT